jgi:integrase
MSIQILDNYSEYLRTSTNIAISSQKKYYMAVRKFILKTGTKITVNDINKFILESTQERSSYNTKYALHHFLISIGKKEWLSKLVKAKRQPRKKTFEYIPKETFQKILDHLPSKWRKLAFMQYKTGARFQEIITLRSEKIDWHLSDHLIYISIGEYAKGKKERKLRLSKRYEGLLRKWAPDPYGFIFLDRKYEGLPREKLLNVISNELRYYDSELNRIGNIFGIKQLSSHYLRHLFSDNFQKGNPDNIVALKQLLGHSRIETTLSYVSTADTLADNALIKMEQGGSYADR